MGYLTFVQETTQAPQPYLVFALCAGILLLCIVVVVFLLARRRAFRSVKRNSTQYNTLLELNRWYDQTVDRTVNPEYQLYCECPTVEKCDRFDFFSHMLFDIEQNLEYYRAIIDRASYNQAVAQQYQNSFQEIVRLPHIPARCAQGSLLSYRSHVKMEDKLVARTKLEPFSDVTFQITACHFGSLGRKYRNTATFSLVQINALYGYALDSRKRQAEWQQQCYPIH